VSPHRFLHPFPRISEEGAIVSLHFTHEEAEVHRGDRIYPLPLGTRSLHTIRWAIRKEHRLLLDNFRQIPSHLCASVSPSVKWKSQCFPYTKVKIKGSISHHTHRSHGKHSTECVTPAISAFRRLRQEDREVKASLSSTERPCSRKEKNLIIQR
jgi:hypothetical protein